jgi:rod shape-determining protein MreC
MLRASREPGPRREERRSPALPIALVLASLTLITVDRSTGEESPLEPARTGAETVLGPVQQAMSAATRPVSDVGHFFTTVDSLRDENEKLAADNAELRARLAATEAARTRLADYDALDEVARKNRLDTVEARVVAVGPAQSFARTVTISAGSRNGVGADMTVYDADGLVGRVLRTGLTTATVLLIVDAESVVGGRLGSTAELAFLRGSGDLSGDGRLTMTMLDNTTRPVTGDTVVSWGSQGGVPYIAGVPVGAVEEVQTSARDSSATVSVRPFADFSSLDVVAVVTGAPDRPAQHSASSASSTPASAAGAQ